MTIVIIKIGRVILNIIYFFFKLKPSTNKVTMISRQNNMPSDEFLMIKEEIEARQQGTKVVMLCKTLDGKENSSLSTRVRYALHIFTQMHHIASSRVVLLDTYCIPVSLLRHKKSLTIIQMWHSIGTMKKFGYAVVDTEEGVSRKLADAMHMHENYDYIFASGEDYKEHLAAGFHTDVDRVVTMPLPRVDKLINDKTYEKKIQEAIYKKYPVLKEKPNILYAPTFRMDESGFLEEVERLVESVDTKRFNLIISLHPLSSIREALKCDDRVIVSEDFNSFAMIFVAKYMISDYSCILYEAGLRQIPLFFYNFDMDSYVGDRGLALDYATLPGFTASDAKEIAEKIKSIEVGVDLYDYTYHNAFIEKYVTKTAHATKDIVDFVYKHM